jgi:hypothetical protein
LKIYALDTASSNTELISVNINFYDILKARQMGYGTSARFVFALGKIIQKNSKIQV